MSIEADKSSCPHCSTNLQYYYINLTEKMLICTKKKCPFPFDMDDVSPYIIKADSNDIDDPSSSSTLDDKFLNLTQSKSTSTTQSRSTSPDSSTTESLPGLLEAKSNGVSTQSKSKIPNSSNSELASNKFNNVSANSKSFAELSTPLSNPLNKVGSNFSEGSTSNSNGTITLKTLGITLKIDSNKKNKSQSESFRFNGLSTNSTENKNVPSIPASDTVDVDMDFTRLFNIPNSATEGSSANTIAENGLLNANVENESGSGNTLTVEEYSKMLFGQSDIDINLDNLLSDPNTIGSSAQNDDVMDIDELFETFNSLEPSTSDKTSGNDMNFDLESFMASLDGNFAETGIPNGMSGNDLNMDLDSILANTNGNILDLINSQNIVNGHFNVYSEIINGNNNDTDSNHSMLDLTLESVNGQNGYSHENFNENIENIENTKNGVVEDEGKEVMGKTTNEDSVALITEGKKVVKKRNFEEVEVS